MNIFRLINLDKFAWTLRRYYVPVDSDALVLEVGSGGNPFPRSNILLDAYEATQERHWEPLITDRPTILGFGENLPFKDKSFDFVIAAHVLEHSTNPAKFLTELQRVAKSGYIEAPNAIFERLNPYKDHRLEIECENNILKIRNKAEWKNDVELVEMYEKTIKSIFTKKFIPKYPFDFHIRFFWKDHILYEIMNPETSIDWTPPESTKSPSKKLLTDSLKKVLRNFIRVIFFAKKT